MRKPGSGHALATYSLSSARLHTMGRMKIFNFIHLTIAQAFYRWALREINPLHPDVPHILRRQRELADKATRIFA